MILGGGNPIRADVAIRYEDAKDRTGPRYGEIGNLEDVAAVDTLDVTGMFLHAEPGTDGTIRAGEAAVLTVRRDREADSEVVWNSTAVGPSYQP